MKFSVQPKDLQKAVKDVSNLLASTSVPKAKFLADKNKLVLLSDFKGRFVRAVISAEIEEPGSVVLDLSILSQLKFNGKDKVSLTLDKDVIKFKCGRFTGDLKTEADDKEYSFPKDLKLTHQIDLKQFKSGVDLACYSSTITESEAHGVVVINLNGKKSTFGSHDAYCLTHNQQNLTVDSPLALKVHSIALSQIFSAITEETFNLGYDEKSKTIRVKDSYIDFQFQLPEVNESKIVDTESKLKTLLESEKNANIVTFAHSEAVDSLREVSSFCAGDDKAKLHLNFTTKACKAAVTTDYGSVESSFKYKGSGIKIAVPLHIFMQFLEKMRGCDEIKMSIFDKLVILHSGPVYYVFPTTAAN